MTTYVVAIVERADDRHLFWVELRRGCIAEGTAPESEVLVFGDWRGRRVEIERGGRMVYPHIYGHFLHRPQWWDGLRPHFEAWLADIRRANP